MSLHCENIVKTYGGKDVLHDVTLDLKPGKIYGLIGRNGAGKTTLLSILAAQNPASKGAVTLDGEPVWENRKSLAKICFSRELPSLISRMTSDSYNVQNFITSIQTVGVRAPIMLVGRTDDDLQI